MRWLALALAFGVPLRFYRLDQPQLWLDELLRLVRFSNATLWNNLQDLRMDVAAAPLDYMIQSVFIRIWGLSEFAARFHAALFGCLAIVALYWVGKTLLSPVKASVSAFLLAFFPLHIFYSREAGNYSLFLLLTLCSFGLFSRGIATGKPAWWVGFLLSTVANLYTNYFAATILVAQAIIAVIFCCCSCEPSERPRISQRRTLIWSFFGSAAIASLLFLPWVIWTWGSTKAAYPSPFNEASLVIRLFKELSGGSYPLSALALLLVAVGFHSGVVRKRWKLLALLTTWLIVPGLLVLLLDAWRGYFVAIRQLLFVTPPLIFLMVMGIESLDNLPQPFGRQYRAPLTTALLALMGVGTVLLSDRKEQADWKGLTDYLETNVGIGDIVAAPNVERVILLRSPRMKDSMVDLKEVAGLMTGEKKSKILIVQSRYATSNQKEETSKLLAASPPGESVTLKGFEVYSISTDPME